MRLRRETGDFQIVINFGDQEGEYTVNSIRPGLSAEDFIGEVLIGADGAFVAVTFAKDGTDAVILSAGSYILTYVPSTGAITAVPTPIVSGGLIGGQTASEPSSM